MHDFDVRIMFQIIGALLYITNFLLLQTHRIHATKPASLLLVISACSILLTAAIIGHDWGLILLEGTWLVMVTTTFAIRQRAARRQAVLEREAAASAVAPVRPTPVAEPVQAPGARERELVGAAV
jgi:low temperature requirement protein LtrA